jgi:hypothetical protein
MDNGNLHRASAADSRSSFDGDRRQQPGFSSCDNARSGRNNVRNGLTVEMMSDDDVGETGSNAFVLGSTDGEYGGLCEARDDDVLLPCVKFWRVLKAVCWPADAAWTTVRGRHLRRVTLVFVPSLPMLVVAIAAAIQLAVRYRTPPFYQWR